MPELPDLVNIVRRLRPKLMDRRVTGARVQDPLVLRLLETGSLAELVTGLCIQGLERHGPFLRFQLRNETSGLARDLVLHLMLAGRLRLAPAEEKRMPHECFALILDDGQSLSYADEKRMGKVYLGPSGLHEAIPGYLSQGVDISGPEFTWELFSRLIAKKRCQARVFVMDQTLLSAVGNAYADEMLFEAGIHPKASCSSLPEPKKRALYEAIKNVLAWGVEEVEKADKPLEDKVREHMRVRNRAGSPCPRCGTTIRKAGVLGFDAFFCPICQPDKAGKGLDWTKISEPRKDGADGA